MKPYRFLLLISLLLLHKIGYSKEKDTITLEIPSDKYKLQGQMVVPKNIETKKIPAIIFVVGSGLSSYRTNYDSYWKYFLAEPFENKDIAIINFDKRGIGKSTGKWYNTTIEQRAEDTYQV